MASNKTTVKGLSKSDTFQHIAQVTGLSRKQVAAVMDELSKLVGRELGKKGPGIFTIPGLLKVKRIYKPATKAREGINPFTKQPQMFKAKPARNVVKAVALKGLKDMVK